MATDYVTDGKIGIDLTAVWASISAGSVNPFMPARPGDRVHTNNNGVYVFARAQSDIAQYNLVVFNSYGDSASLTPTLQAVPATTTNVAVAGAAGMGKIGIAQTCIASGYYGWIALNGDNLRINALIACNPKALLFTTATAGSVDDATVSAGYVCGITLNTSATSASSPFCSANWPHLAFYSLT